ncbi:UNVERIFIED_CONTAM: hypothetical protein Sradi_4565600 [Sesamum radiatum]|uniref:Uncharacterized protein n=1 Tax=Sesamum radiatum TaxID=300843 RepID=A0AAW2NBG8_SESRA
MSRTAVAVCEGRELLPSFVKRLELYKDLLLRALIDRGWHFKDTDRIRGLIKDQLSLPNSVCTVDSVESELLNMDLRSIGGKCLPEPSVLRKTSHLQGPMVLQVPFPR